MVARESGHPDPLLVIRINHPTDIPAAQARDAIAGPLRGKLGAEEPFEGDPIRDALRELRTARARREFTIVAAMGHNDRP